MTILFGIELGKSAGADANGVDADGAGAPLDEKKICCEVPVAGGSDSPPLLPAAAEVGTPAAPERVNDLTGLPDCAQLSSSSARDSWACARRDGSGGPLASRLQFTQSAKLPRTVLLQICRHCVSSFWQLLNTVTVVAQTDWHSGAISLGLMMEPCLTFSNVLTASFLDITAVAVISLAMKARDTRASFAVTMVDYGKDRRSRKS